MGHLGSVRATAPVGKVGAVRQPHGPCSQTKDPVLPLQRSPEVIRLVVMMYVKFPLSLRNVEDLLAERGIDLCHETVRFWWNRFDLPLRFSSTWN